MGVNRPYRTECGEHVHMPGRIVQMIVTANSVRDPHVVVIDDHGKVLGRRTNGARNDQVIELGVVKYNHTPYQSTA